MSLPCLVLHGLSIPVFQGIYWSYQPEASRTSVQQCRDTSVSWVTHPQAYRPCWWILTKWQEYSCK